MERRSEPSSNVSANAACVPQVGNMEERLNNWCRSFPRLHLPVHEQPGGGGSVVSQTNILFRSVMAEWDTECELRTLRKVRSR